MKKIYYSPQIRIIIPVGSLLNYTDSVGDPDGQGFNARHGSYFEEEDEEEITNRVWFDD